MCVCVCVCVCARAHARTTHTHTERTDILFIIDILFIHLNLEIKGIKLTLSQEQSIKCTNKFSSR